MRIPGSNTGQKWVQDPQELELEMVVRHHVGAGNWNLSSARRPSVLNCWFNSSTLWIYCLNFSFYFLFDFLAYFFICVCLWTHIQVCMNGTARMWTWEDNYMRVSFYFFNHMSLCFQTEVIRLSSKQLCLQILMKLLYFLLITYFIIDLKDLRNWNILLFVSVHYLPK